MKGLLICGQASKRLSGVLCRWVSWTYLYVWGIPRVNLL